MSKTNFENLRVYRLAEELADAIRDLVADWNSFAKETVGKQIVRCADSIGANIAEGSGRGSFQDNRGFIKVARASLNETQHFLRRAFKRKLLSKADVEKIKPLVDNLAPQLNAYLSSIGRTNASTIE